MKLEKKLREVSRLEERAAAGEVLDALQLEKIARVGQIRASMAELCGQADAPPTPEEPTVPAAEPTTSIGGAAQDEQEDVDEEEEEEAPTANPSWASEASDTPEDASALTPVASLMGRELPDTQWESPPQCQPCEDWARKPKAGRGAGWKKSPKGSWKGKWSSNGAPQWDRDTWMAPLGEGATSGGPAGPFSEDVCWQWQEWGCCPRLGKCSWEHPGMGPDGQRVVPMPEPQTEIHYYQVVGADSDGNMMLGDLVGVEPGPIGGNQLMYGAEMMPLEEACSMPMPSFGQAYWED
jgi:hypothetical protein